MLLDCEDWAKLRRQQLLQEPTAVEQETSSELGQDAAGQ